MAGSSITPQYRAAQERSGRLVPELLRAGSPYNISQAWMQAWIRASVQA